MMELMLDTANIEELTYGLTAYPICGVTSNPSILKKEGSVDLYQRLSDIKKLCGKERSFHVQVVSNETDKIIEEAHHILSKLGKDTYIKIPVSNAGVPAIKALAAEGINITATAIYSTMQGILAVLSGAKYIAVYYNRMENNNTDPQTVISEIQQFIEQGSFDAKVLAASFKNVNQVVKAYASGAESATVPMDILTSALNMVSIEKAVEDFAADFEAIHGKNTTMLDI